MHMVGWLEWLARQLFISKLYHIYKKAGYVIQIKKGELTGRVAQQHLRLKGEVEASLDSLVNGGRAVLKQKKLQLYSELDYDPCTVIHIFTK